MNPTFKKIATWVAWIAGIGTFVWQCSGAVISYVENRAKVEAAKPVIRQCILEPVMTTPPDVLGKPFPGKWRENDGMIEVVQEPNSYSRKWGSEKGPTVWTSSNVFEFSFNPVTGEGSWSSTAAKLSGKIKAYQKSAKEPWKVVRYQGEKEEAHEVFLFRPL